MWNYSWPLFPYIWHEVKFQIAYDSDLESSRRYAGVTEQEVGEEMMSRVRTFRELLAHTPINELEVQERPVVFFPRAR